MKELMNIPINDDFNNVLPLIDDKSIDLIFADLPFNTTNCKWDRPILLNWNVNGLEEKDFLIEQMMHGIPYKEVLENWKIRRKMGLWQHYNRIIKDDGVILLYAQTPFDKELGMSNKKNLRYEWIWEKSSATGHLNSKKMPMKAHENILVFYNSKPPKAKDFKRTYNYIKTTGHLRKVSTAEHKRNTNYTDIYGEHGPTSYDSTERFPRSVLKFKSDKQLSKLHSTQKPLALTEYMIETYSNEGDIVLDNCAGSYVVAEASNKLKRNWICIEKDEKIHNKSIKERKL
jgi:DNA modification methylase